MSSLKNQIFNLLENTACSLPTDVENSLKKSASKSKGNERKVLNEILENVQIARDEKVPICQDTGTVIFFVTYNPKKHNEEFLRKEINSAVREATEKSILRPNSVDSLTDKNLGNIPEIHFMQGKKLKIDLLLKGGGSENCARIYKLPNSDLKAERNFDGVKKCVIDTVEKAQGKGCPPYVVGVAIGGSVSSTAFESKKQLMRKLNDKNKNKKLNDFENSLLKEINKLKIGAMGFGGSETALAVKVSTLPRHPASYVIAVSLSCWCDRRCSL
ncbi:MAG: fumarate hydratase [Candidatus Diapherotrites archaeon]